MNKEVQKNINDIVYSHYMEAIRKLPEEAFSYLNPEQMKKAGAVRLKSCQAWVWDVGTYYILQSYGTYVACIEKETDICYDFLRVSYGFTRTSAQHIAKFKKAKCFGGYSSGKWGCAETYVARSLVDK